MKKRQAKWKIVSAVLSVLMIASLGSTAVVADDRISASDASVVSVSENTEIKKTESEGSLPNSISENVSSEGGNEEANSQESQEKLSVPENGQASAAADESAEEKNTALVSESQGSPMYRLYNPNTGEHFYTSAQREAIYTRNAGWNYEGIGWYAPDSGTPVYRLYNPNSGDHHYTMNVGEKNYLASHGWKDEGIRFYSSDEQQIRLTRQYNPNAKSGSHNYTTNEAEANALVKAGWHDEGTAWYAVASGRGALVSDLGPTTYYRGKDYSEIYDFNYYINHNNLTSKYANDDQGAIKYFVEHGLFDKQQAKEGVAPNSEVYTRYRKASDAYLKYVAEHSDKNLMFANQYSSATNYLITVNRNTHMVYVYQGSQGDWKRINSFACGDGAPSTPTVEGKFAIYGHKRYFDSGSVRCFYASMFHGAYYFHSTLYAQTANPQREVDGRVGMALSHGCVRVKLQNAEWIYTKIPTGTAVVVSRW